MFALNQKAEEEPATRGTLGETAGGTASATAVGFCLPGFPHSYLSPFSQHCHWGEGLPSPGWGPGYTGPEGPIWAVSPYSLSFGFRIPGGGACPHLPTCPCHQELAGACTELHLPCSHHLFPVLYPQDGGPRASRKSLFAAIP